jgi:hypothetical protein
VIGSWNNHLSIGKKENHMTETLEIQDAPVFSFALASADMRYIEIGEREIYLRNDPEAGLVFRGEIFGCGPGCIVDLSEILLEYAMSCEGCREQSVASEEVARFGEHLAEVLVEKTYHDIAELPTPEKLSSAFKCILNSMSVTYIEESKKDHLEYSLDCCPLSECAKSTGLSRSVEMAHLSFTSLCKSLIKALAPDWLLMQPSEGDTNIPIHKIVIASL